MEDGFTEVIGSATDLSQMDVVKVRLRFLKHLEDNHFLEKIEGKSWSLLSSSAFFMVFAKNILAKFSDQ